MFYNVYLHYDKKENKYECGIDSYEKLIVEYIMPYLRGEKIFF